MESIYLKTLIEVARTGSLTKAAESLYVTQSAVSRRIKFLETQYSCDLIDRSGQILVLTKQGELVREKAQKILEIEKELKSALCLSEGEQDIAFVCTPTFGIVHLPQVMREFMLACPDNNNLKFMFRMPGQIVSGLKEGRYDMAVIEHCQCFDLSDFETIPLHGDEMVFTATPALRMETVPPTLETIFQQTLYTRAEGCCSRTLLESNLNTLGHDSQEFRRLVIYDDLHIIIRALIDGLGIGFLSNELLAPYVASGQLTTFKIDGFTHERRRTLVYNGQHPQKCFASQFIKTLLVEHAQ